MPTTQVVIGILTGGRSSRMGRDKATTVVGGSTMANRVATAARSTGLEALVLGPDDAGTGLGVITDQPDAMPGPLGGLMSLLAARPDHDVVLVATDQALVHAATLEHLARPNDFDVVVPVHLGVEQVTCARYSHRVGPEIERRRGTSGEVWRLRSLLDAVPTRRVEPHEWAKWGEDGRSFRSLDRPEDIAQAMFDYPD